MRVSEHRQRILEARHYDPFAYLGMHLRKDGLVVRVLRPDAKRVTLRSLRGKGRHAMRQIDPAGLFEVVIRNRKKVFEYTLEYTGKDGSRWTERDPYSFLPIITDYDLHLFNEGNHYQIHEKLGSKADGEAIDLEIF